MIRTTGPRRTGWGGVVKGDLENKTFLGDQVGERRKETGPGSSKFDVLQRRGLAHLAVQLARHELRLLLVLPGDVPSDRVVAGERSTAVRAWHAYSLMPLAYVRPQVRLVAVLPVAQRAL